MTAACRREPEAGPNARRYRLKGEVVRIEGREVTIAHERIDGYMDAMVMPFRLKEEWVYKVLQPGDRVDGVLVVDGTRSWLEQIVIAQTPKGAAAAAPRASAEGALVGQPVPDFELVNQDGTGIRFGQYRGRTLVLTFIYTRCPIPDFCPRMSAHFARLDEQLKKDPARYASTHLLSISFDPEHDTPRVLREYGLHYVPGGMPEAFRHWEFATGSDAQVQAVARFFGLEYWPEMNEIVHSLRTAVIGPDGRVAKLFAGNEWEPDEVIAVIAHIEKVDADPSAR